MLEYFVDDMLSISDISSNGSQRKWRTADGKYYVKEQLLLKQYWKDNLVEKIGSTICKQLNIEWLPFAEYEECVIHSSAGTTFGCVSKNFLQPGESLVEIWKLMELFDIAIVRTDSIFDIFNKLVDTLDYAGIKNASDYLSIMFLVDYLLCNTDRHLSNISVVKKVNPIKYSIAPLFDFGQGLFQGTFSNIFLPIPELVGQLRCNPYGCSFSTAMYMHMKQTNITKFIPKELDVLGLEFPDYNSAIVLGVQCKSLDILLKGVQQP